MCAHLERHVLSLLNRFCGFYEEKDSSFFWEKIGFRKRSTRLDKIGHFTKRVDISFDFAFIHAPREREKTRESVIRK